MAQMTLEIPQALAELPERERVLFLQTGWYAAWRAWRRQVADDVADAETHANHLPWPEPHRQPADRLRAPGARRPGA